mgnify:CR=1 FL=1
MWGLHLCSGCTFPRIIILNDPLSAEEHLSLGVAYERNGEYQNAIEEYRLAAKRLNMAYLYLGNAHFQKKEFDQSEKYYKKMIAKKPEVADAYNNLAWLYYIKREHLKDAEDLALRAITLNPANENIYLDTIEKIRQLRQGEARPFEQ